MDIAKLRASFHPLPIFIFVVCEPGPVACNSNSVWLPTSQGFLFHAICSVVVLFLFANGEQTSAGFCIC